MSRSLYSSINFQQTMLDIDSGFVSSEFKSFHVSLKIKHIQISSNMKAQTNQQKGWSRFLKVTLHGNIQIRISIILFQYSITPKMTTVNVDGKETLTIAVIFHSISFSNMDVINLVRFKHWPCFKMQKVFYDNAKEKRLRSKTKDVVVNIYDNVDGRNSAGINL